MKNLSYLATQSNHFTIAAFDHRGSLQEIITPEDPHNVPQNHIVRIKKLFIEAFADISSAVLIDPVYGLDYDIDLTTEVPEGTGILMSLEKSGYTDTPSGARSTDLLEHWGIAAIKKLGFAAKLLLYYHPHAENAKDQLNLVQQLSQDARDQDTIFLVEPILYGLEEYSPHDKLDATLITVKQLAPLVDILKLEFPLDVAATKPPEWVKAAQNISKASTVPWILLSRGMDFDHFKQLTQVCCENGASGIAVGRAVWKEIQDITNEYRETEEKFARIKDFLMTTGRDRMQLLSQLVKAHASPWTDFQS